MFWHTYWARGILISLPAFVNIVFFLLYCVTGEEELLFVVIWNLVMSTLIKVLKFVMYRIDPVRASRPIGANDCRSFPCGGASKTGMPSGHSASAAALATYAILRMADNGEIGKDRGTVRLFVVVFTAILVMMSRMVYNCHTLAQVLVGALVGTAFGYYMNRLWKQLKYVKVR